VIRHLKQDLDRFKDENEELHAQLEEITHKYLLQKAQVE
jgi:septation ring formation regulator EzrA